MRCKHWDSSCHLGSPNFWKWCQQMWIQRGEEDIECSELQFIWKHYPDSPWGDVDICAHGVCRTHDTSDAICRWCG